MDFDKQEKELNCLINEYLNCKANIKWRDEEIKLNEERQSYLHTRLFFAYISRYLDYLDHDIFDAELEAEYKVLN